MADAVGRNLTILLTDIKEFTPKTSGMSRQDILNLLNKHKEIVLPLLENRGGKLVKTMGDAFLVVFDSPTDAVLAGVEVQDALKKYNENKSDKDRIDVRIAINQGEVTLTDNDVFGEPVNITARLESVAQDGEVFFTEAVYLAMNKKEVPSSEIGLFQLKGIPEKIRVYKVRREHPVDEGADSGPTTLGSGLLGFIRGTAAGKAPPAAPQNGAERAPLIRRTAAVLIDCVIVGILTGMLFSRGGTTVHYSSGNRDRAREWKDQQEERESKSDEWKKKRKEIREKRSKPGQAVKVDLRKGSVDVNVGGQKIQIDDGGIHGDKIEVTDERLRIGDAIDIQNKKIRNESKEKRSSDLKDAAAGGAQDGTYKGLEDVVVTLDADNMDVYKAFDSLAEQSGVKIVVAPGIKKTVTFKLEDVPLEEAVDEILAQTGLAMGRMGKNTFEFVDPDAGETPKEIKLHLNKDGLHVDVPEEFAQAAADKIDEWEAGDRRKEMERREKRGKWEVQQHEGGKKSAFPVLWVLYSTFFLTIMGATPGKKILKLRVVRVEGDRLDWKFSLIRSLFMLVSFSILFLGFLWALWEKDRRAWHDLIAGTMVVRA